MGVRWMDKQNETATFVRAIDAESLAHKNQVIITRLDGITEEYRIDDPLYHLKRFRVERRAAELVPPGGAVPAGWPLHRRNGER